MNRKKVCMALGLMVGALCFGQQPNTATEQGMYFAKKSYVKKSPLPTYQQIKPDLPQPIYDENPLWLDVWWKAWELVFAHFYEPTEANGFVSPYFDSAFGGNTFLWDDSFVSMFTNYAHPMVSAIAGLDNFYCKQYSNGEICREITRATGKDYTEWVNTENVPLYSAWGYFFLVGEQKHTRAAVEYIGRPTPSPNPHNTLDAMNHPILAWAEWESYKITGDKERLKIVLEPLVKYYEALQKYIRQGNGLYMTDWASMDNSQRNSWLAGGGTGIDISSEMALFARNLSDIAGVLGKKDLVKQYAREADELSAIINKKMWNARDGFYFDLNLSEEQSSIKTVAGFWPLVGGVASAQQAQALAAQLQNPKTFGRKYPVPTLAADQKAYKSYGDYWNGANWAPTNTMVIRGLEKYGYDSLASTIALKHLEQVADVFKQTNTIWENYMPDSLSYGLHLNGWSAGKDVVGWSGMGPVMYFLEYGIGLKPDAVQNQLTWTVRSQQPTGCRNYRFNGHTVSLIAKTEGNNTVIEVDSDGSFTLNIKKGERILKKKIRKGNQKIII
ncbi:trehalase [Candidatus Symbiothrix dinenymphae]|nr:trehalase [Candidatus Symbiothrix dinenymphae]